MKIFFILVFLGLTACTGSSTPDELIKDAKRLIEQKDYRAANVTLKSVLQKDPSQVEARLLLGQLYFEQGLYDYAIKELEYAQKNKDFTHPIVNLAESYYFIREYETVISYLDQYSDQLLTPLLLNVKAHSMKELGDHLGYQKLVKYLQQHHPDSADSKYYDAIALIEAGKLDAAEKVLATLVQTHPNHHPSILLMGELYFNQANDELASQYFTRHLEIAKNDVRTVILLINTLLKQEQFQPAKKHVDALLQLSSESAELNFYKSIISYDEKDYQVALSHAEKALNNGYVTTPTLTVASLSAVQLNKRGLALRRLSMLSERLPKTHPLQDLYLQIRLEQGYIEDVVDEELIDGEISLDVLSQVFLAMHQSGISSTKVDKLVKSLPVDDVIASPKLSNLYASLLNDQPGLPEALLQQAIEGKLDWSKEKLLVVYLLQNDRLDELAKLVAANSQDNSYYAMLSAYLNLKSGKSERADDIVNNILNRDPNDPIAIVYQAEKRLLQGESENAYQILDSKLDLHIFNRHYIDKYFAAAYQAKKLNRALDRVVKLSQTKTDQQHFRLYLASKMLKLNKANEANQQLAAINRDDVKSNPKYWSLKAKVAIMLGQHRESVAYFKQAIAIQSTDFDSLRSLVGVYTYLNELDQALAFLTSVLTESPNYLKAKYLQLDVMQKMSKFESILSTLSSEKYTEQLKLDPRLSYYFGSANFSLGEFKSAEKWLTVSYQLLPTIENTALLFKTKQALNKQADATQFLAQHVSKHPQDAAAGTMLTLHYVKMGNKDLALTAAQQLANAHPNAAMSIALLAKVNLINGFNDRARELIEPLMEQSPAPVVVETYTETLFSLEKYEEIVATLSKIEKQMPLSPKVQALYQSAQSQI